MRCAGFQIARRNWLAVHLRLQHIQQRLEIVKFQQPFAPVEAVLAQPLFLVVVAVFLGQLFNWLKVLEHADLSFAQPITSLAYVTVTGLSWLLFAEPVGWLKMAGILCILAGVWLISGGQRITVARADTLV